MEKPKKYEERLMDALAFDEDDLDANQAGHFSPEQRARFIGEQRKIAVFAGFFTLLLALWIGATRLNAAAAPALFVFIPIFAALFLTYAVKVLRLSSDLREDRVLTAEGRVALSMKGSGSNQVECTVKVGAMRFRVKQPVFLAFKNGDPYCIYYTRRSKRLLSAEWLRENDDNLIIEQPDDQAGDDEDVNIVAEQKAAMRRK